MLPSLISATTAPAGTMVRGSIINAVPGDIVAVDVYGSHAQGESEVFLDTIDVMADAVGSANFDAPVLASGMRYITAYATANGGRSGTSALSNTVENARPPVLTVTNTNGSSTVAGSYAFALAQAAMTAGPEIIEFAIPDLTAPAQITPVLVAGSPPREILLKDVIIDGTTQGGGGLVPRVYIVGSGAGTNLHFVTSGVTIFGMGFANARGIDLEGDPFGGDGFNRISRNFLGVSPVGQPVGIRAFDTRGIVRIFGDRNIIDHNVIHTGQGMPGIWSFGGSHNRIESNRIGVSLEGQALPLNRYGIQFSNDFVSGPSDNNVIVDNVIGYTVSAAISIEIGTGNRIQRNTMIENGGPGIDLGEDGPTANDPLDADAGPNGLQNFPAISRVRRVLGGTRIIGTLDSAAIATYELDFYSTPEAPAANLNEGRTHLGAVTVTTDASGDASFNALLPAVLPPGHIVVATATGPDGTSEFAAHAGPAVLPGDIDGDGLITAHDFFRIDRGIAMGLSGPDNGDLNNSGGPPDGDDVMIIDRAFLEQQSDAVAGAPAGAPPAVPAPFSAAPIQPDSADDFQEDDRWGAVW
jgi:hypothetical protein